ncbi:MAG: acyl--CoA ligase [Clostridia bacterium]|nr:acyl--CoA ligase [Clostridia bacterium]
MQNNNKIPATSRSGVFKNFIDDSGIDGLVKYDTLTDMWEDVKERFSDCLAVQDNLNKYTYRELDLAVGKARLVLSQNGVKKGERVGVFINTCTDFAVWYLAVVTLSATAVIIPDYYSDDELSWAVNRFGLNIVLTTAKLAPKLDLFDGLTVLTSFDIAGYKPSVKAQKEDVVTIIFTGGVSGKLKGALLSSGAIAQGALNGCLGLKEVFNQRYFLVLPLSHVFGLIRNFLSPIYVGGAVYFCSNMATLYKSIPAFAPSYLVLVPALAEMILKLATRFGAKILGTNLKYIICGGSAVSPEIVNGFNAYGISVYPGYGLTESSNLVSGNYDSINRPTSVGLPFFNQQLKIVDGELLLKGDNLFSGYFDEPEENLSAFSDGYFKTGDLVRVDDEGYIYITGRKKNIIILSNGENVTPSTIEDVFKKLDFVENAIAYEDVDEQNNSILALKILPRKGISLTKEEVFNEVNKLNNAQVSHKRATKIIIE